MRTDVDDIWQKYSKYSRIEFAHFSFHVGLLVIMLSSFKLHTKNNVCMFRLVIACSCENSWLGWKTLS